jgi:glycosyltransferase involved in cell wall biosynthesis
MKEFLHGFSVIMPTYNYGSFILKAINSVLMQSIQNWELIIVDDGSTDNTEQLISPFLKDSRIVYKKNESNLGLGASLNIGIELSKYDYISYLPADDIFFESHLEVFSDAILEKTGCVLYFSLREGQFDQSNGRQFLSTTDGRSVQDIQLVQVVHRRINYGWVERDELVTDDLNRMYWSKIADLGDFGKINRNTCKWVPHLKQRSNVIKEGVYAYKQKYGVKNPIRFHSSFGQLVDELSFYEDFRKIRVKKIKTNKVLNILIVGELAFNSERISSLIAEGHNLYGAWIEDPNWYNTVGPLPFGNLIDVKVDEIYSAISRYNIDIIYALLNYQAVSLAFSVLSQKLNVPFVWHFKEGPDHCNQRGLWDKLIYLFRNSDGRIYVSNEAQVWFNDYVGESIGITCVLDGDLPNKAWFTTSTSDKLSSLDSEPHILITGRPLGLSVELASELLSANIHLHFYGELFINAQGSLIRTLINYRPGFVHIHRHCNADTWVTEYSKYDAGWGHVFKSENYGEVNRMTWDDMNIPARIPSLASAGLPVIQFDNSGHIVASQRILEEIDGGIFFTSTQMLIRILHDRDMLLKKGQNIWNNRDKFTFDYHLEKLTDFFHNVVAQFHNKKNNSIIE